MSVPQANRAVISEDPRDVMDRTRRTPGTRTMASSSGRVTVGIMRAAGASYAGDPDPYRKPADEDDEDESGE